jgi:hypothetical protein
MKKGTYYEVKLRPEFEGVAPEEVARRWRAGEVVSEVVEREGVSVDDLPSETDASPAHGEIEVLLREQAAAAAALELFVSGVNNGPGGNWTAERMVRLQELQAEYADVMRKIEAHPDGKGLKSKTYTAGKRRSARTEQRKPSRTAEPPRAPRLSEAPSVIRIHLRGSASDCALGAAMGRAVR